MEGGASVLDEYLVVVEGEGVVVIVVVEEVGVGENQLERTEVFFVCGWCEWWMVLLVVAVLVGQTGKRKDLVVADHRVDALRE